MRYGSVAAMVAWLDREENAAVRERKMRTILRRLPPRQRKFALVVKRVLEVVPGPENLQREKIMEALKIKVTRYYELRQEAERNLV